MTKRSSMDPTHQGGSVIVQPIVIASPHASAFLPNRFVDISSTLDTKLRALRAYALEMRTFPHARSIEAVQALATWRGATVGVAAGEAFMLGCTLIRQD